MARSEQLVLLALGGQEGALWALFSGTRGLVDRRFQVLLHLYFSLKEGAATILVLQTHTQEARAPHPKIHVVLSFHWTLRQTCGFHGSLCDQG